AGERLPAVLGTPAQQPVHASGAGWGERRSGRPATCRPLRSGMAPCHLQPGRLRRGAACPDGPGSLEMAGLAGGCRWQRCRLGAGPVLKNDSDEWRLIAALDSPSRTHYIATALLAQQGLALPRRQGIQPALQRMGGETQLRQQKDRIGAALAAVAVTEIGPAAIQQTGLESQQVQRHV